jgi:hypothetical protein
VIARRCIAVQLVAAQPVTVPDSGETARQQEGFGVLLLDRARQ